MRPMPSAAAERWSSRAARATSSGCATANHSRVKRPRASASGALKAPDFATSRDTRARREMREHVGHSADAGPARARASSTRTKIAAYMTRFHGDHAEDRKGEHVDAPRAVERGQRDAGDNAQRDDDGTRRSGAAGKTRHGVEEGMARDDLRDKNACALHAHALRGLRMRARPAPSPRSPPPPRPRRDALPAPQQRDRPAGEAFLSGRFPRSPLPGGSNAARLRASLNVKLSNGYLK